MTVGGAIGSRLPSQIQEAIAQRRAGSRTLVVREQFGAALLALGAERPDLVALTADLMYPTGITAFAGAYPERFVNVGIAAGLASCGKVPVVCGYAAFTTLRAVEQAKVDCAYNNLHVVLTGQSAGLSYGVGGPTHQTFEDVAIMRAIPNMTVVVASDPVEVGPALRACVEHDGPVYLRLGRGPEYVFNEPDAQFEIGKAVWLRDGGDACIVANGPMVFEAVLAADALAEAGIHATVLNVHTVKPIDREAILRATVGKGIHALVVAEEHNVYGGLGSAVLEVLEEGHAFPVRRIGIADAFPPIGPTSRLRVALGLTAENIAGQLLHLLDRQETPSQLLASTGDSRGPAR